MGKTDNFINKTNKLIKDLESNSLVIKTLQEKIEIVSLCEETSKRIGQARKKVKIKTNKSEEKSNYGKKH